MRQHLNQESKGFHEYSSIFSTILAKGRNFWNFPFASISQNAI